MKPKSTPPCTINIAQLPESPDADADTIVVGGGESDYGDSGVLVAASPMYSYINPMEELEKSMMYITTENIELRKRMVKMEKAMEIIIRDRK